MRDVKKYEVFQLADQLVPGNGRQLSANGFRRRAQRGCWRNCTEPSAVSRRPMADMRQIAATDKAIDQLVYELYGLTDKEIRIVEEGAVS